MAGLGARAGDIVPVTDANGNTITTYIMTRTTAGQRIPWSPLAAPGGIV